VEHPLQRQMVFYLGRADRWEQNTPEADGLVLAQLHVLDEAQDLRVSKPKICV